MILNVLPLVTDSSKNVLWVSQEGELQHSDTDNFRLFNVGTNGKWVGEFEVLIDYIQRNVKKDSFVEIPCEDPVYWASGTMPQLDFFQLYPETCPYNKNEILNKIIEQKIKWVIIKEDCQFAFYSIRGEELNNFAIALEKNGYLKEKELGVYTIYKCR